MPPNEERSNYNLFQNRLSSLRQKRGWSQSKLAKEAQLTQAAINQFEKGDRRPSLPALDKLSDALGVSVDFLIGKISSTQATEPFPDITTEVIERSKWIEILKQEKPGYETFAYGQAQKEAEKLQDKPLAQFYGLLREFFSMMLSTENPREPFKPMAQWEGGGRTAIVTDFTEKNLILLKSLIGKSNNSFIDARISDVLWLRKKGRQFADRAIEAYLKHATEYLNSKNYDWLSGRVSLERAIQLWNLLNQQPPHMKKLFFSLCQKVVDFETEEPKNHYRIILADLVSKYQLCDFPKKWETHCFNWSKTLMESNNFDKTRRYLEIAINFAKQRKNAEKIKLYKKHYTDSYIAQARFFRKEGFSAMFLSHHYQEAIESCRRHGGLSDLIDELRLEMNEIQKNIQKEMKPIHFSFDASEPIKATKKAIEEASIKDIIPTISLMVRPREITDLENSAQESYENRSLLSIIRTTIHDEKGRTVGKSNFSDKKEDIIKEKMISEYFTEQTFTSSIIIETARTSLLNRLNKTPVDDPIYSLFKDLVHMNPFIPEGREDIFLKGLESGLQGDFIQCAHLLIPQLENSIRFVLEQSGELVTGLSSKMIQKEHNLNKILDSTSAEKIFGPNTVFCLKVFLTEELAGNYRNKLAHGLISSDGFTPEWVNYLWALTIRLCYIGSQHHKKEI